MEIIKTLLTIIGTLVLPIAFLAVIPGIPPTSSLNHLSKFLCIHFPMKVDGWFATNTILDEAEVYYKSPVGGLESVVVVNDNEIYAADKAGFIIKVTGKQVAETVTQLKFPCEGEDKQKTCSGTLGMRMDKEGKLLAMDFHGGLIRINLKLGTYENLIPKSQPVAGKTAQVPEDVVEAKDGRIYWTDGSTSGDFFVELFGQPSGRLIRYDPIKKDNEVLLNNLHFSNGVCLSDKEEFILVGETGKSSILKYYLQGPKKGQTEIFVDGLPGYPDNIRSNGRGGFYVPLIIPSNEQYSLRAHLISGRPLFRKLVLRARHILLRIISYAKRYFSDNVYLNSVETYVTQNEFILNLNNMPLTATIVELSNTGKMIGMFNGKSGSIFGVSEISVGNNYAYIVSPLVGTIWRIKLEDLQRHTI